MSEEGWRAFLGAGDVDDWIVLHGGATSVFRCPSLAEADRAGNKVCIAAWPDGAESPLDDPA